MYVPQIWYEVSSNFATTTTVAAAVINENYIVTV